MAARGAENLADEIGAALQSELFRHNAQGAVGGDEVHRRQALVANYGEQKVLEKDGSAGSGGRNGQILRQMIRQVVSGKGFALEHREAKPQKSRREARRRSS